MSELNPNVNELLGNLSAPYYDYLGVVASTSEARAVMIPLRPEVAADKVSAALQKLGADSTYEDYQAAMEKAQQAKSNQRKQALIEHGFVGTITDLFDKVMTLESDTDPQVFVELKEEAEAYRQIPAKRRRGAKLVPGVKTGYYWAGTFVEL